MPEGSFVMSQEKCDRCGGEIQGGPECCLLLLDGSYFNFCIGCSTVVKKALGEAMQPPTRIDFRTDIAGQSGMGVG